MAQIIRNLQINWSHGSGTDLSSLRGFNVAITVQGSNPTESDIAFKNVDSSATSTIFNNIIVESDTSYTAWVQTIYKGKDSDWESSGNISVADDGTATISDVRTFTSEPTVPYNVGDIWLDGSEIKRCSVAQDNIGSYDSGHWIVTADGTSDILNDVGGFEISTGTVDLSGSGVIKSSNYDTGVAGWAIDGDGSAEFSNVVVRGTVEASDISGGTIDGASITGGSLKIIDTTTEFDDYVELTEADLTFFKNNHIYKSVKRIESGEASNDDVVVFDYDFQVEPVLTCSAKEAPTYSQDGTDDEFNQSLRLYADNITTSGFTAKVAIVNSGTYDIYSHTNHDSTSSVWTITYDGFTSTNQVGFSVNCRGYVTCDPASGEEDCPLTATYYPNLTISYKIFDDPDIPENWTEAWNGPITSSFSTKSYTIAIADRYHHKLVFTHSEDCSNSLCSLGVRYAEINWGMITTEGQTEYASGDMYWIAIEGGKIVEV